MGINALCLLKCIFLVLCAAYLIGDVEGRGGRGGGSRGGSRGGFRSSRTSTSFRSRSNIRTSRGRFPAGWKVAAGVGMIYGWSSYRHRSSYRNDQSREPQICENRYDYLRPNGTNFAYFICPMANQSESYTYCCGQSHRQHCCRFWDSGSRVTGLVFGILFAIAAASICIFCCYKKHRGQRPIQKHVQHKAPSTVLLRGPQMGMNYPQPGVQHPVQPLFPVEPNPLGPQPYPHQPAYPPQQGYPPQPTNPNVPYPVGGGGCPYPTGPQKSGENGNLLPHENTPSAWGPASAPPQPYGMPPSAAPPPYPVTANSDESTPSQPLMTHADGPPYPRGPPPMYPGQN